MGAKKRSRSGSTPRASTARHPVHGARAAHVKPYIKYPDPHAARPAAWDVASLCAAYQWPSALTGGGVIAIVELGGGWRQSDIAAYFRGTPGAMPSITDVSVGGVKNAPGKNADADTEVALDIQVAAMAYHVATGKRATIRMYWANDIAAAVRAATADGCDVCSISWGSDEANWGKTAGDAMAAAAQAATTAGMVVLAAAGDNDSSDGGPSPANVDLPASCPHVIGCGGTSKTATSETVWNNDPGSPSGSGTGGGYSTLFQPLPTWQIGAPHGPGRMVPDVAANADPNTGYNIIVQGKKLVVGGTSAVAPLYAGLIGACGRQLGYITPELWMNPVCFNDITQGDNGAYRAAVGPDPCTGLGSPIGTRIAKLLADPASKHARLLRPWLAQRDRRTKRHR